MSAAKPLAHVLIIRPGALGDTLMMLPALADLAPATLVTFLGRRPGIDFLSGHVDRVMDMEGGGWHRLFLEEPGPGPLPASRADAVVAFLVDDTVRKNLKHHFPQKPVHLFETLPEPGEPIHVALHVARKLAQAGLPLDPDRAFRRPAEKGLLAPRGAGSATRGGPLVLHPGSGSRQKNFPWSFWRSLLSGILGCPETRNRPVALVLGPAEEELLGPVQETSLGDSIRVLLRPGPEDLSRVLQDASLFVGHDSGVTHLAALHGTPTLALFRASDPVQWRPLGPRVRVLQKAGPSADFVAQALDAAVSLLG